MEESRRYLEVFIQKAVLFVWVSLPLPRLICIVIIAVLTPGFKLHCLYCSGSSAVNSERFGTSALMRNDSLIIAV